MSDQQVESAPHGKIAIGECREHGYLMEPDVNVEFPHTAECNKCGRELKQAKIVDKAEVKGLEQ